MKIWSSYGSEHSMNLVMIGHFNTETEAEQTVEIINMLKERVQGEVDARRMEVGTPPKRYSRRLLDLIRETKVYHLGTIELEQFVYEVNIERKGGDVVITTDEADVSAFLKVLVDRGARVEVYSAHTYPNTDHGRGKS